MWCLPLGYLAACLGRLSLGKCDSAPNNHSKSGGTCAARELGGRWAALFKFSFKTSCRGTSVHLKCLFKKINKWLKTDISARGKTYYLSISLIKTEVKYQPALDKQHTEPSITLSHAEQNTLTGFTWLSCFPQMSTHSIRELGPFPTTFCQNKDLPRNSLGYSLTQSKFP